MHQDGTGPGRSFSTTTGRTAGTHSTVERTLCREPHDRECAIEGASAKRTIFPRRRPGRSARAARPGTRSGRRRPGVDAELVEDVAQVAFDGLVAEDQLLGDLTIRAASAISVSTSRSRAVSSRLVAGRGAGAGSGGARHPARCAGERRPAGRFNLDGAGAVQLGAGPLDRLPGQRADSSACSTA